MRILGGIITAYLGSSHTTGTGKCGSITVGLSPFNVTPNPGEEYKVWMTKVGDYDAADPTNGAFGFLPSRSKTDTFKISPAGPGD